MSRQTGGSRVGSNFHKVELGGPGDGDRLGEGLDAELFALAADEQHFAGSDAVVDPGVVCGYDITSMVAGREQWRTQEASATTRDGAKHPGSKDGPGLGAARGYGSRPGGDGLSSVWLCCGRASHFPHRLLAGAGYQCEWLMDTLR